MCDYTELDRLIERFTGERRAMLEAQQRGDDSEALRLDAVAANSLDALYEAFEEMTANDVTKLGELLRHPDRLIVSEAREALLRIDTPQSHELAKQADWLREQARKAFEERKRDEGGEG